MHPVNTPIPQSAVEQGLRRALTEILLLACSLEADDSGPVLDAGLRRIRALADEGLTGRSAPARGGGDGAQQQRKEAS